MAAIIHVSVVLDNIYLHSAFKYSIKYNKIKIVRRFYVIKKE